MVSVAGATNRRGTPPRVAPSREPAFSTSRPRSRTTNRSLRQDVALSRPVMNGYVHVRSARRTGQEEPTLLRALFRLRLRRAWHRLRGVTPIARAFWSVFVDCSSASSRCPLHLPTLFLRGRCSAAPRCRPRLPRHEHLDFDRLFLWLAAIQIGERVLTGHFAPLTLEATRARPLLGARRRAALRVARVLGASPGSWAARSLRLIAQALQVFSTPRRTSSTFCDVHHAWHGATSFFGGSRALIRSMTRSYHQLARSLRCVRPQTPCRAASTRLGCMLYSAVAHDRLPPMGESSLENELSRVRSDDSGRPAWSNFVQREGWRGAEIGHGRLRGAATRASSRAQQRRRPRAPRCRTPRRRGRTLSSLTKGGIAEMTPTSARAPCSTKLGHGRRTLRR